MVKAKFALGQVVATPGALDALERSGQSAMEFIQRHVSGEWGEVDVEDAAANDEALVEEGRVLSAYTTLAGERIWVITEWNREMTTLLLPEDY